MGRGAGKGRGCCSDSKVHKFETFAGDNDTDGEEGQPGMLTKRGWPPNVRIERQGRCKGIVSDLPMCVVFMVFWIIMFVFASIAFEKGDPRRLIFGTDYQGNLCGTDSEPHGWSGNVTACQRTGHCQYQDPLWSNNTILWYPLPYDGKLENSILAGQYNYPLAEFERSADEFDFNTALSTGVCVNRCPQMGYDPDVIGSQGFTNFFRSPSALRIGLAGMTRVVTYGPKRINADGTWNRGPSASYFYVWYNSKSSLRRCVPAQAAIAALNTAKERLPSTDFVDDYWNRALRDVENAWEIFAICGATAIVLCVMYTFLLRCCLKPFICFCILLTICLLALAGSFCWTRYKRLDTNVDPEDDNEAKVWLAGAFIFYGACAGFTLAMICMQKQIRTACEIIIESGRVIRSDMTMLLVPIITALAVCLLTVWIIIVALYIYTIEEEGSIVTIDNTQNGTRGTAIGVGAQAGGAAGVNVTQIEENITVRNMLYYVFFGWLWTMGLFNAIGFFVVAACTVQWYYSYRDDDSKKLHMVRSWLRGFGWSFQSIGGLVTGAFLVALVQFAQLIVEQFTEQLQQAFGEDAGKCILCIIRCCLACLERILRYITKNAYVIMAVQGSGFWCACCDLMAILLDNVGLFAMTAVISEIVFFVGKLLVTIGNCIIAYLLLEGEYGDDVQSGLLIIIIVGVGTYIIACLFIHVYGTCIDAMLILTARELRMGEAADTIACPGGVFKIVTGRKKDDQQDLDAWREENKAKCAERKSQQGGKVSAAPGES
eukprot:TRINITY_DN3134_c2_g1_i1.p1 TRINITY_DN3134_c2_g1~~TRINITY_DN3134_c2_g1_i1.p1  ORF type:complete len:809 (+),score=256.33 TRINITY_DN3134_c2_g1_i1:115-2427(+)